MKPIYLLILMLTLTSASCSSISADSAQGALEPYSVSFDGTADGLVAFNARYIAVNAKIDMVVSFRNRGTVLWSKTFKAGAGQKAFRILFDQEDKFIDIVAVPWSEAAGSLTWLP